MPAPPDAWNHNLHQHPWVLSQVPDGARTALDVGTGDGLLARDLARLVPAVTAVDLDADVLARARANVPDPRITWQQADALALDGRYDVVASIATLHHLPDPAAALRHLAGLVAPGGVLVIVGLARAGSPADLARELRDVVRHRRLARTRNLWEHSAPTLPPTHTYAQVRALARAALPGAAWTRLPLWRYGLTWRAPRADPDPRTPRAGG